MDNVTFREVQLTQSQAEKLANENKEASPLPSPFSTTELDKIVPPLSIYKEAKGVPYTVDYLGIKNEWNLADNKNADETFGNLQTKVRIIEGYIKSKINKNFLPDEVSSYKNLMKMIDKVVHFTTEPNSLQRLNKVYSFVVSNNKTKALNNLRKSLLLRSIDQLVNLDEVKADHLGSLMPRKI